MITRLDENDPHFFTDGGIFERLDQRPQLTVLFFTAIPPRDGLPVRALCGVTQERTDAVRDLFIDDMFDPARAGLSCAQIQIKDIVEKDLR